MIECALTNLPALIALYAHMQATKDAEESAETDEAAEKAEAVCANLIKFATLHAVLRVLLQLNAFHQAKLDIMPQSSRKAHIQP